MSVPLSYGGDIQGIQNSAVLKPNFVAPYTIEGFMKKLLKSRKIFPAFESMHIS